MTATSAPETGGAGPAPSAAARRAVVPPGWRRGVRFGLRTLAAGLGVTWLWWHGAWLLLLGQMPPSLFLALTGRPCGTTGMTRSLLRLLRGDLAGSVALHPFAVPLLALTAACAGEVCLRRLRRERVAVRPAVAAALLALLALGWIWQIALNPALG